MGFLKKSAWLRIGHGSVYGAVVQPFCNPKRRQDGFGVRKTVLWWVWFESLHRYFVKNPHVFNIFFFSLFFIP